MKVPEALKILDCTAETDVDSVRLSYIKLTRKWSGIKTKMQEINIAYSTYSACASHVKEHFLFSNDLELWEEHQRNCHQRAEEQTSLFQNAFEEMLRLDMVSSIIKRNKGKDNNQNDRNIELLEILKNSAEMLKKADLKDLEMLSEILTQRSDPVWLAAEYAKKIETSKVDKCYQLLGCKRQENKEGIEKAYKQKIQVQLKSESNLKTDASRAQAVVKRRDLGEAYQTVMLLFGVDIAAEYKRNSILKAEREELERREEVIRKQREDAEMVRALTEQKKRVAREREESEKHKKRLIQAQKELKDDEARRLKEKKLNEEAEKEAQRGLRQPESAPAGPPEGFLCPISAQIMLDPVIAADGYTYEKTNIEEWMDNSKRRGATSVSPISKEPFIHPFLTKNINLKILIDEHRSLVTQHTPKEQEQQVIEQHLQQRALLETQYQAERFARYQEEVFQAEQLAKMQAEQLARQQADHQQQLADHHAQQLARHQEQQLFLSQQQALKYQEQQAEYQLQQQQFHAQQQAVTYQEQQDELLLQQSIYAQQQQNAFHDHGQRGHTQREERPMQEHYSQYDLKGGDTDEFDNFSFQGMSFLDEQEEERPLPPLMRAVVPPAPEVPKSAWTKGTPSLIGQSPSSFSPAYISPSSVPPPYISGRSRGPPNANVPQEISPEVKGTNLTPSQNSVSSSSQPTGSTGTAAATDPEAAARRLRYLQDKEEADFQRAMALSIEEESRDKERREAYDKHVDDELHSHLGPSGQSSGRLQASEYDDSYSPVNSKKNREKSQHYLSASEKYLMPDTPTDTTVRPAKSNKKSSPSPDENEDSAVVAKGFRPVSRKAYCCIHFAGSMGMKNLNGGLMMCHKQRGMMCFNGEHVEAREVTKKKALEIASGAPARSAKFSESITLFINKFPHFMP
mmetsp:Transcript_3080/g.3222  ORF Transcript_3080/g.3222 Transcript_3080/m.3222 type:complete len:911 (+) Transcript_3080:100-2832(+)